MASLTCLAAARHRAAAAAGWDVRRKGFAARGRRWSSISRRRATAASARPRRCWGSARTACCQVPVDGDLRMDVAALAAAVARDRAAGRRPFCVAASAGTVNTGRDRPARRPGRALPARGPVAPRRRGVRRDRRRRAHAGRPLRRPLARGLGGAGSAQVALGAGRVRLRPRARRSAPARHVEPRPSVSPDRGGQGIRRPALVLRVRLPADAGVPGAEALDDPPAHGAGRCGGAGPPPREPGSAARDGHRRGLRISSVRPPRGLSVVCFRYAPPRWSGGPGAARSRSTRPWSSGSRPTGASSSPARCSADDSPSAPASSTTAPPRPTSTPWWSAVRETGAPLAGEA